MAKVAVNKTLVAEVLKALPHLLNLPSEHMWIDYDKEADVLYISFEKPQKATDSELLEDDILLRYRKNKIVGITVLRAKDR